VYLTHGALRDAAAALGVKELPYFTQTLLPDKSLIANFSALQGVVGRKGATAQKREAFVIAMGDLFRRSGGGALKPFARRDGALVRKIAATIDADFARDVSLADLAACAGLSVWQLIGLFKRTVGLTPHVYQTQARLNAACRALRRGTSIAEAALASGFYDQSALTSHFKARFGMTPLQFVTANTPGN
jgi:AraC-like DNA-binding protein